VVANLGHDRTADQGHQQQRAGHLDRHQLLNSHALGGHVLRCKISFSGRHLDAGPIRRAGL
jgi:hypothetical protein